MWEWLTQNSNNVIAISSILALVSLVLIFLQIYIARLWNKLHFTYTFFPDPLQFAELEEFLDSVIRFWRRDSALTELEVKALTDPESLSDSELKLISENLSEEHEEKDVKKLLFESERKLKLYLNQIESYCAAIRTGIIDSDSAKMLYGFKFKRTFNKAKPYIDEIRTKKNANTLFCEIENVLNKWNSGNKQKRKFW